VRIGIMSDSHGDLAAIRRALAVSAPVDMWLHAGDYASDALFLAELAKVPVEAVAGNNDETTTVKSDEFLELQGKKIWLTHGHRHKVRWGTQELIQWGHQYDVQLVVFGHTHLPQVSIDGQMLLINPGSVALPPYGRQPTIAMVEVIAEGQLRPQIIEIPFGR
jgi:putative phosphoesterase